MAQHADCGSVRKLILMDWGFEYVALYFILFISPVSPSLLFSLLSVCICWTKDVKLYAVVCVHVCSSMCVCACVLQHVCILRVPDQNGELLTVTVRWLGNFANILFFEHQNDIFNAILRMTK